MSRCLTLLCALCLTPALAAAASVTLGWEPGTGGGVPTGYIIERKVGTGAYAEIGRPGASPFTDATVPTLQKVCWQARAYNAIGVSSPSNEVCLDLPAPPINLTIQTAGPSAAQGQPRVNVNTTVRKRK